MKKKLIPLIVLFLFCYSAHAQFSIEPKAGLAISNLYSETEENSHLDLQFGVNVGYNFSPKIGLKSGIEIINKGANDVANVSDKITTLDVKQLRYMTIPLLFSYKFGLDENIHLSLEAGLYYARGIHGSATAHYGTTNSIGFDPFDQDNKTTTIYIYSKDDFGWRTGLTLDVKSFLLGCSYERGFNSIDKFGYYKGVNKTFCLSVGYRFTLGNK